MPAKEINGVRLVAELTKDSDVVTTYANVAGALSRILSIAPNERQYFLWPDTNVIRMKLFDSDGNQVEANAELALVLVEADGAREQVLAKFTYGPYRALTMAQQWDPDREPSLAVSFVEPDRRLAVVGPGQRLELRLKSSHVVDWDYASGENQTQFSTMVGEEWATT